MNSVKFSVRERIKSFSHAFRGLLTLIKYEHNSRIHLAAAVIVVCAGFFFKINQVEWIFIVIVTGLVFITELINSSLESLADRTGTGWNELIRNAKDYSAAAVLIAAVIAVITGLIIFIPRIVFLLR